MSVIIKVCVYYKSRYATWLSKHLKDSYVCTYRIAGFCREDFYLAIGSHSKNTYEIRLEICTGFVAISNEMATTTLWPLVIATVAIRTAVGHLLNGHNAVGAVVCTVFYAVFPY